jgi:hypothetical protein
MTAQIEPSPRQGRELSTPLPMYGLGYLAWIVCYAATSVATWALLTSAPAKATFATAIAGVAWLLGAVLEGCHHAE